MGVYVECVAFCVAFFIFFGANVNDKKKDDVNAAAPAGYFYYVARRALGMLAPTRCASIISRGAVHARGHHLSADRRGAQRT